MNDNKTASALKAKIYIVGFLITLFGLLGSSNAIAADVTMTVNWPAYSGENSVQIFDATDTSPESAVFTDGSGGGVVIRRLLAHRLLLHRCLSHSPMAQPIPFV